MRRRPLNTIELIEYREIFYRVIFYRKILSCPRIVALDRSLRTQDSAYSAVPVHS